MSNNWLILPLDKGGIDNQFSLQVGISPNAKNFLSSAFNKNNELQLGVTLNKDNNIKKITLCGDNDVVNEAIQLGLQVRVELVTAGYALRDVNYSEIHGVETDDLQAFSNCLELSNGMSALDLMCGYGAVGQQILSDAKRKNITVDVTFCDLYEKQLSRISDELKQQAHNIVISDARNLPFDDNTFDAVAIKMGIHEVPQYDQSLVFQQAHRVLKPGGIFAIWDIMPDDPDIQDAFNAVIQKKNALAGFESFLRDRYFIRENQATWLFKEADFEAIEVVRSVHFKQSNKKRLVSELGNDLNKLQELNEYTRMRFPPELREKAQYDDTGDDISLVLPNLIMKGRKKLK